MHNEKISYEETTEENRKALLREDNKKQSNYDNVKVSVESPSTVQWFCPSCLYYFTPTVRKGLKTLPSGLQICPCTWCGKMLAYSEEL